MDIDTLKREALRLPPEERARLASELLESLDELPQQDADRFWLGEAARRGAQVDSGEVQLVSSDEVDRKARALLQLR
jgi:Putative addiction module component